MRAIITKHFQRVGPAVTLSFRDCKMLIRKFHIIRLNLFARSPVFVDEGQKPGLSIFCKTPAARARAGALRLK